MKSFEVAIFGDAKINAFEKVQFINIRNEFFTFVTLSKYFPSLA